MTVMAPCFAAALLVTSFAVVLPHHFVALGGHSVDSRTLLLIAAMALWGVSQGSVAVVESIFADSVPTGALLHRQASSD